MFPYKTLYILALVAITNAVPITVHNYALTPTSPPACVAKASQSLSATPTSIAVPQSTGASDDCSGDDDDDGAYNTPISGYYARNTVGLSRIPKFDITVDNVIKHLQGSPVVRAHLLRRAHKVIITRIAQPDLPQVAQEWQDLCLASGGDIFTNDPCVKLAGEDGINALLAGDDPCAQQDNADAMIDFANSANITNRDALVANAVAYRKHPRNALNINGIVPSTPFCQKAPRNPELQGLVNAQLDGVDLGLFGGPKFPIVAFGASGTCPFGQTPDVSTCSCN